MPKATSTKPRAVAKTPPRSAKKTPPRSAKKKAEAAINQVTSAVYALSVEDEKLYSFQFIFPKVAYTHITNRRKVYTVELFVPTLPNSYFRPGVKNDGCILAVSARCPDIIVHPKRQVVTFQDQDDFNDNTHANTAYQEVANSTLADEKYNDGSDELQLWSDQIEFILPFKCEQELRWEVQNVPNNLEGITDELGQQYFSILAIRCISVEKPKSLNRGGRRIIANLDGDDDDDDGDEEEEH